ncbi:hypothetical protein [Aquimarina agarilytica]|uniref:hypothetical protein n=1 Tax=Aquimarina agarilytica TaxID=1087449 RepID=UPI00028940FF|nr:hypothetical protein [Aquimarina agarilytica]
MKASKVLLFVFACTFLNLSAQKHLTSFSYKKGEILDIILLSVTPNSKTIFERYKKTAFPVAFEYSYQPQPNFGITKNTLGNHLPHNLFFGKWKNKEKREDFLKNITTKVPDFHEQRRQLFTYFGLTYYEATKDLEFSVNTKKLNTATSFWKKDTETFSNFVSQWKNEIENAGGKFIIELNKGTSPLGYDYNPDLFCIIEWKNKSSFKSFAKKHPLSSYNSLKNVQQFVIN